MKLYRDAQEVRNEIESLKKAIKLLEKQKKDWEGLVGIAEADEVTKGLKYTTVGLSRCDRKMQALNVALRKRIAIAPMEEALKEKVADYHKNRSE